MFVPEFLVVFRFISFYEFFWSRLGGKLFFFIMAALSFVVLSFATHLICLTYYDKSSISGRIVSDLEVDLYACGGVICMCMWMRVFCAVCA